MNLQQAKSLKVGDPVWCDEDKFSGTPAGPGKVSRAPGQHSKAHKDLYGRLYVWVEVERLGYKSVWPSNRLA